MTFDNRLQRSGLRLLAWIVVAAIGAVYAWAARHEMNPDGIAYLDIADAFARGDWSVALNRLWSPLYPLLLAATLRVLRPLPSYEFATVRLLNFVIFLAALASFEFFLNELICYQRKFAAKASSEGRLALPEWSLRMLGYTVFAYSSVEMTSVATVTPDMCVAVFVYLASGLLLRIHLRPEGTASFSLLGVVLGLGYLAKAPMFPLAFVFLALGTSAVYARVPWSGVLRRLLAALIPFVLITSALVTAFFLTGRGLTLGASGRLNYAWMVNGLPYVHWQGEFPGSGKPVHPTRMVFPSPPVYEFAAPVGGTYPPWDDPAYWYEGVKAHFDVRGHLRNLVRSAEVLLSMLLQSQASLAVSGLLLLYLGRRRRLFLQDMLPYSILLIPALAAVGMFSLIWLELRFIGPFWTLFWLGFFASMTFVDFEEITRVITGVAVAMLAMLILPNSYTSYKTLGVVLAQQNHPLQLTVAQGLQQLGVHPGGKVAVIGDSFGAYWARLSRVRIVAEIPACRWGGQTNRCANGQPDNVSAFLQADQETRDRILKVFEETGAKAVVMRNEDHPPLQGWRRIPDTDYDVYLLRM